MDFEYFSGYRYAHIPFSERILREKKISLIEMKRIVLISDLHGKPPYANKEDIDKCDFVLIGGDFSLGSKSINKFEKEISLISEFLGSKKAYIIPGNNDMPYSLSFNYPPNLIYFHDKVDLIDSSENLVIIGFGGAKIGIRNAIAFPEDEIFMKLDALFKKQIELYPNARVILLVHDAPYNTKCDVSFMKKHIGSESIRKIIEHYQPILAVCGHIHESKAIDIIGKTHIVNAGENSHKHYAVIEIDDLHMKIELKTGH